MKIENINIQKLEIRPDEKDKVHAWVVVNDFFVIPNVEFRICKETNTLDSDFIKCSFHFVTIDQDCEFLDRLNKIIEMQPFLMEYMRNGFRT